MLLFCEGVSIGSPGSFISSPVENMAFDLLVKPALLKMQGVENFNPQAYKADLLTHWIKLLLVDANCYMVVYEGVKEIRAGQEVDILPFDW